MKKHKATAATRAKDSAPATIRCDCGHVSLSKYAHKQHQDVCRG